MRADGQKPDMRRQRRTSGQRVAKSISIKDAKRRCGSCARKATELIPAFRPREVVQAPFAAAVCRGSSQLLSALGRRHLAANLAAWVGLGVNIDTVRGNKGSPGVDGMTVEGAQDYLREHWPSIRSQLLDGTYQPQPVKRVELPNRGATPFALVPRESDIHPA